MDNRKNTPTICAMNNFTRAELEAASRIVMQLYDDARYFASTYADEGDQDAAAEALLALVAEILTHEPQESMPNE